MKKLKFEEVCNMNDLKFGERRIVAKDAGSAPEYRGRECIVLLTGGTVGRLYQVVFADGAVGYYKPAELLPADQKEQVDCWVKRNGRWEKQKFVANLKHFGAEEDTYVTIADGSLTPEVYTSQNISFKEPYEVKSNKWKIKMMVDQL